MNLCPLFFFHRKIPKDARPSCHPCDHHRCCDFWQNRQNMPLEGVNQTLSTRRGLSWGLCKQAFFKQTLCNAVILVHLQLRIKLCLCRMTTEILCCLHSNFLRGQGGIRNTFILPSESLFSPLLPFLPRGKISFLPCKGFSTKPFIFLELARDSQKREGVKEMMAAGLFCSEPVA